MCLFVSIENNIRIFLLLFLFPILCGLTDPNPLGDHVGVSDIAAEPPHPKPIDFVRRTVMIPMRDGVRLRTIILIPRNATLASMVLTRTPYNAEEYSSPQKGRRIAEILGEGDDVLIENGYIRVLQDVRGKYESEGEYTMYRPSRGLLNTTSTDHSTDAFDTIEWLVKNVAESNGKVAIVGCSYDGFTTIAALLDPHPALKAAVSMCPAIDGWIGDDWFHNGAYRQTNFDYIYAQTSKAEGGEPVPRAHDDDYEEFLSAGSAGDYAAANGFGNLPFWRKIEASPEYNLFWQSQALDRQLARVALSVPTLHVAGLWDQEDIYGAFAAYHAMEGKDADNTRNSLVIGPWTHGGMDGAGSEVGPIRFGSDTGTHFRKKILAPFLRRYLDGRIREPRVPPVTAFETGSNRWRNLTSWPDRCEAGCASRYQKLFLNEKFGLAFDKAGSGIDSFVSDPAKPVPFVRRPVQFQNEKMWSDWLTTDQRHASDRTDVLTYTSPAFDKPMLISGVPFANIFASTTGSDADWIVKLIDVYPARMPHKPELGGYQLPIAMEIFRGRYRENLASPSAIIPLQVNQYRFALPNVNHVIQPGHRIMVQIQSSWFPLYDRNPQSYVPNIFRARPQDYQKATHSLHRAEGNRSAIELPIAPLSE
jgi:uncharacterized protein